MTAFLYLDREALKIGSPIRMWSTGLISRQAYPLPLFKF